MGPVLPEAGQIHNAEMRVDVWPCIRCWLAAVVPSSPRPPACNERAGEDAVASLLVHSSFIVWTKFTVSTGMKLDAREECHWSHACKSLQEIQASRRGNQWHPSSRANIWQKTCSVPQAISADSPLQCFDMMNGGNGKGALWRNSLWQSCSGIHGSNGKRL
jgi:hypothetical protein